MTKPDDDVDVVELSPKERVLLEHRLGIRRLLIDRLLIGLLLALAAFLASVAIENFKAKASDSRYFLEKRLEAGTEVRSHLTKLTSAAFKQTVAACDSSRIRLSADEFRLAVTGLVNQLNSSSLLFSKDYLADAYWVVNLFAGAADTSSISCDSRYFFDEIADYFTERTKNEVHGTVNSWKGFQPLKFDRETMDQTGTSEYFQMNLAAWRMARVRPPA
ncbi:hypothetical protein D3C87_1175910 [compost metagenome]